jgi:hypothetical protein
MYNSHCFATAIYEGSPVVSHANAGKSETLLKIGNYIRLVNLFQVG